MLPFEIFRSRNFASATSRRFFLYGGLSVASRSSSSSSCSRSAATGRWPPGLSLLPLSILMFLLAQRFGALADRFGPRLFMGIGPIVAAAGLLLLRSLGTHPRYVTDVLPGVCCSALGLAITVAPLTAAVLGARRRRTRVSRRASTTRSRGSPG